MIALIAAALLWSSWPALRSMAGRWADDPRYSHGFLVPGFSAYLLRSRRAMLGGPVAASAWGLALIAAGEGCRLAGARYYLRWVEAFALLPSLAGLALLWGGRRALAWAAPAIGFLVFMIPLPYRVEVALGQPLQRFATVASHYLLQTMGVAAVAEGNVIALEGMKIGVVEACNGLGMLFMFFAYAVAFVLVVRKGPAVGALLILSAVPIAVAANVARITLTGLLHEVAGEAMALTVYHDLAGWLMTPMALGVLWGEVRVLGRVFADAPGGDGGAHQD
jgi:exosortase